MVIFIKEDNTSMDYYQGFLFKTQKDALKMTRFLDEIGQSYSYHEDATSFIVEIECSWAAKQLLKRRFRPSICL